MLVNALVMMSCLVFRLNTRWKHRSINPRAVDNALTLFRVWPFKNVGAILGHANDAAYADNMRGCGKF